MSPRVLRDGATATPGEIAGGGSDVRGGMVNEDRRAARACLYPLAQSTSETEPASGSGELWPANRGPGIRIRCGDEVEDAPAAWLGGTAGARTRGASRMMSGVSVPRNSISLTEPGLTWMNRVMAG